MAARGTAARLLFSPLSSCAPAAAAAVVGMLLQMDDITVVVSYVTLPAAKL
jgi:hypothetical protein